MLSFCVAASPFVVITRCAKRAVVIQLDGHYAARLAMTFNRYTVY